MERKTQIIDYIKKIRPDDQEVLLPLVEDVVFLEERLDELRKLPFIEYHPTNKEKHRATPASKMYKELLQQYNNAIKTIVIKTNVDDGDEESPLRKYMKSKVEIR